MNLKEKLFSCKYCKKTFTNPASLKNHINSHTGEQQFVCTKCDKSYSSKSSLVQHQVIHNEEKQFPCQFCDKRFHYLHQKVNLPVLSETFSYVFIV